MKLKYFFKSSTSGWITDEIFVDWIKKQYIPEIQVRRFFINMPNTRVLLDTHKSCDNDEFKKLCADASIYYNFYCFYFYFDIDVIVLPAHSSTVLQPLNLIINGRFK